MEQKKLSQEEKREFVRQYYSGKSVREIARETGKAVSTVYRWLKEYAEPEAGPSEAADCFTLEQISEIYGMYYAVAAENRLVRERNGYEPLWVH